MEAATRLTKEIKAIAPTEGDKIPKEKEVGVETLTAHSDPQKRANKGVSIVGGGMPTDEQRGVRVVKRA